MSVLRGGRPHVTRTGEFVFSLDAAVSLTFRIFRDDQMLREEHLTLPVITLGTVPAADLKLNDKTVSRMHAIIDVHGPRDVCIADLGSAGGTFVNGQNVNRAKLRSGDTISVGETRIEILIGAGVKDDDLTRTRHDTTRAPPPPPEVDRDAAVDRHSPVLLRQARESQRVLDELAKLLGHNGAADASLIQRAVINRDVEDGIRRRLEDELTLWRTKCDAARGKIDLLERQLADERQERTAIEERDTARQRLVELERRDV